MFLKILKPKNVIAFMAAFLLALTIADLALSLLYGFSSSMLKAMNGVSEEALIIQEGAKTIHTSWVPLSLAESLNKLPNVKAKPLTLTPSTLNGESIVVRGVKDFMDYEGKIVEGVLPKEGGAWLLIGEKAYKKLRLKIGEIVAIGSPKNSHIAFLTVTGVYRLNDLKDYEAVVPLNLGLSLAGLPKGFVSAIQVEGIEKNDLKKLLGRFYSLEITYEPIDAQLIILDALNTPIASISLKEPGPKKLNLPFGYYTLIRQVDRLTSNITSVLLIKDEKINLAPLGESKLKALLPIDAKPVLISEAGEKIEGVWAGDGWLFKAHKGVYNLKYENSSFKILIEGDSIFNPALIEKQLTNLEVKVLWQDGVEASNYIISVKKLNGELIFGVESLASTIAVPLPEGEYEIEVSKPPYLARANVKIPSQKTLTITLPSVSNPAKIPLEAFQRLKPSLPIEASTSALSMLIGLTASALLALTATLTILSILALFAIHKALYASAKENIKILSMLGARKSFIVKAIATPILALNLILCVPSVALASTIHGFLNLSILGYGLPASFSLILLYSIFMAIASWLPFQIEIAKEGLSI